jgi:hypothetical protein
MSSCICEAIKRLTNSDKGTRTPPTLSDLSNRLEPDSMSSMWNPETPASTSILVTFMQLECRPKLSDQLPLRANVQY